MSPLEFLRAVWPIAGLYCIATPYPSGGFKHAVFETIDAATSYVERVKDTENVYFAIHTLKAPKIWNNKTQEWQIRTHPNARCARAFFFDLDVGKSDKKYPSQTDAIRGLLEFCKQTGLPKPMAVSSGSGVHVYWVIDQEIDSATEWLTQASRLKQLAKHYGLRIDPARTTDRSSVLRVAGTWNLKGGERREVKVLAPGPIVAYSDFKTQLLEALGDVQLTPEADKLPEGLEGNLKKGDGFDMPPPSIEALKKVCAQFRRLEQLGTAISQPEWYHGQIGLGIFVENGPAEIHRINCNLAGYDKDNVDAKIAQHQAFGPTTCVKIMDICGSANEHLCKTCPYVGQQAKNPNVSPISIARNYDDAPPPEVIEDALVNEAEPIAIPNPPLPYRRLRTGGIGKLTEGKEGADFTQEVYRYDLYPLERAANAQDENEQQMWRVHLPFGLVKTFAIEADVFVDSHELEKRLARQGVYTAPSKFKELRAYMSAYIQELIETQPTSVQYNHLGWIEDRKAFVLPQKVIRPGGATRVPSLSRKARAVRGFMGCKGSRDKQIEALKFFNDRKYVDCQFYILGGLASVYYYATTHNGVVLNATGDTSTSKSTSLLTSAAFWGPPKMFAMNGTDRGLTELAIEGRRDMLGNLPLCLDEITNKDEREAKNWVMAATQAVGRIGQKRDGTEREQKNERSSITMTTSNRSVHAMLQTNNQAGIAGSLRVFEIEFRKRDVHEGWQADEHVLALTENYGFIGPEFVEKTASDEEVIAKHIRNKGRQLQTKARMGDGERFWFATTSSHLIIGLVLAKKLGWVDWDMRDIEDWLFDVQIPYMRGVIAEERQMGSPTSILAVFLERINQNMIRMEKPHTGNIPYVVQEPRGELLADYDQDARVIYVLKEGFKRYCERWGYMSAHLLVQLSNQRVVTNRNYRRILGLNSKFAKAQSDCFVIDMTHPDIAGVNLPVVAPAEGPPKLTVLRGGKVKP